MRLLNTNNRVPGGWRYTQLDAKGQSLHKWEKDFDPWMLFLGKVQAFRKANQLVRQDIGFVESDVTEYLACELGGDPRYFTSKPAEKKTSRTLLSHSPRPSLAHFAEVASELFSGSTILAHWFGNGLKPVANETAQARTSICLGANGGVPCPHNQPGLKLVGAAARRIQRMAEKKNEMKLTVAGEEQLQSCNVCLCDLKLKVFVPMQTILDQTPQAMLEKFAAESPPNCWMRQKP